LDALAQKLVNNKKNKMRQGKGSIDRISARRSPAQTPKQ
jgi:hypothetical protein